MKSYLKILLLECYELICINVHIIKKGDYQKMEEEKFDLP